MHEENRKYQKKKKLEENTEKNIQKKGTTLKKI